jgi:hypothetical protein
VDSFKKIGDIEELEIIECMGPDQKQNTTTTTTPITLETVGATDPWMLFFYALKAPARSHEGSYVPNSRQMQAIGFGQPQRKRKKKKNS